MKELSIFVDESGDFGPYEAHSPFYIFTLIFHNQANSIANEIQFLENGLSELGLPKNHCFHVGPIIRREEDYQNYSITERRKFLNKILSFAKNVNVSYATFITEKKHMSDSLDLTVALTKKLSSFIREHYTYFMAFERIVVYYDNGQVELGKLLASVFLTMLPQVEFKKVLPADYRLFQMADLVCTMELIYMKEDKNILSKSEMAFFGSIRDMRKNYLKPLFKKKFNE